MERLPTPPGERPAQSEASSGPACTATATISEQGVVTGWSEGARRLLGHEPAEVVGQPAARLLAGDVDPRARPVPAGRERWNGTVALRHRDGRRLELRLLAHHRTSGGVPDWLVVSPVPGGPRAGGSRALEEWAFRQSPCVLAVFDPDLRVVRANGAMERALALTETEMRGLRLADIAPGPGSDAAERTMRLALESGEPQEVEAALRPTGAGTEPHLAVTLTPLKDPDGHARAVCLTAQPGLRGPGSRARERTLQLRDAAARIGTTLDLGRTVQELGDVTVPLFADLTAVDLLDFPRSAEETPPTPAAGPVVLRRAALRSLPADRPEPAAAVGGTTAYAAASPPAHCLTTGRSARYAASEPVFGRWLAHDPSAALLRAHALHSLLTVPIVAHGTTLGVVLFGRRRGRDPFDPAEVLLAEELTARAAVSIHNARRHTRARTTTMALQRSLLPQTLPDQKALDIASRYLPAGSQAGVGGDWFDVIPLSGARVALVVGDVVGHGIRASATMGRVRTAVRTLADVDLPPDELLTHLDDLVLHLSVEEGSGTDPAAETAGGIGTTCLYAVYDPVSRRCTLARAGHPPPAVVTPEGAVRFLDVPAGPPLGLGGLPFEAVETELPEGSLLALYTDGLLAVREHDIDEALDRMFAALARPAGTLDAVCDRVLTALLTRRPEDDVALLVARTRALHADRVAAWDLVLDPAVVAEARRHAARQLTAWGLDDAAFLTELMVSELVTNALRYGRPPVQLRLIHQDSTLICEVYDSSSTTPHMRRARTFDEGGRGLLLVAQLAQRWGTRHDRIGKTVWAEQSLAGP
jgi:PAS domain S-box-containing protein